jgi:tRNA-splicing ligase RtcB
MFMEQFIQAGFATGLPDRQLVAAPIQSPEGQKYWKSMAAAANFAFNNRQKILHQVREAFHEIFSVPREKIVLLYDVCHNIAKMETHVVDGKPKKLCVHRKGATRALGPGSEELIPLFRETGQPVLVPGDMGRASHIMVGLGHLKTWCSACHGAGRAKSRVKSLNDWKGKHAIESMKKCGVSVLANSQRTIAEEMPDAYKNVDEVVDVVEQAGLAKKVVRLKPSLVIKG